MLVPRKAPHSSARKEATYAAVARMVGDRPQHYHSCIAGDRPVSVERVMKWVAAWEAKGRRPLMAVLTSDAATLREVDDN